MPCLVAAAAWLGAVEPCQRTAEPPMSEASSGPTARWELGPPDDPSFFPIGVWLQDPRLAERYERLGINTYVGLWQGPTEEQLAALAEAGMKVVCGFNAVAEEHLDDPAIVAWMLPDEPDNRDSGAAKRVRLTPAEVDGLYRRLRERDPRRPVFLNLGQGVANDAFKGRGARPEEYRDYAAACDILSFDVYPVANLGRDDGADFLWLLAKGLERLRRAGPDKVLWNFLECTDIKGLGRKASPAQVRAEAWISVVHGSRGLVWFVHRMQPEVDAAALLGDPPMMAAVHDVNEELTRLAPVLAAPSVRGLLAEGSSEVPVAALAKRHAGALWVLAVGMRNGAVEGSFRLEGPAAEGLEGAREVEVVGEERSLPLVDGAWRDAFEPWGVHLYRLRGER